MKNVNFLSEDVKIEKRDSGFLLNKAWARSSYYGRLRDVSLHFTEVIRKQGNSPVQYKYISTSGNDSETQPKRCKNVNYKFHSVKEKTYLVY